MSRINCHRLRFSADADQSNCNFLTKFTEDEYRMLFQCRAQYTDFTTKFSFEATQRTGPRQQQIQRFRSVDDNTFLRLWKFTFLAIKHLA